jgi:hypothetical protein
MDPAAMLEGRSRETRLRRDASGRWWDGDDPIAHPLLVQAFDAWIERAEDGRFCLKNDINWAYVTIEGAPIDVRTIELPAKTDGAAAISLHHSDGRTETLDPSTLREGPDGALYCEVRGGTMPARLSPHAAVQLDPLIDEDEHGTYIQLGTTRIRPPRTDEPLTWRR